MLTFFEKELVEKHKWITNDEFAESVALGQITPGPPIINTGICIGYKLKKIKGILATTLGQVFTGTLLAILLAVFYIKARDNVVFGSILKGVGSAVVGLLLSITYKMARGTIRDYKSVLFAGAAFVSLAILKFNPIAIILAAGFAGFLFFGRKAK